MIVYFAKVLKVCCWIYLGIISANPVDSQESDSPVDNSTSYELLHQTSLPANEDGKEISWVNLITPSLNLSILKQQDNDKWSPIETFRFRNDENKRMYEIRDLFPQENKFHRTIKPWLVAVGIIASCLLICGFGVIWIKTCRRSKTPSTATPTRTDGFMGNNSTPAMNSTEISSSINHSNSYSTMPLNPYLLSASLHQNNHPGGISNPEFLGDDTAVTVPDRNNDLPSYSDCYSHTTTTNIPEEPPPSYSSVVEMNSDVTST